MDGSTRGDEVVDVTHRLVVTRRTLLGAGLGALGLFASACTSTPAPAPTTAPSGAPASSPAAAPAASPAAGASPAAASSPSASPAAAPSPAAVSSPAAVAPGAGASAADLDALYAEAKKEGKVVWWTAHYAQSAAEIVRDAFVARFPGIEVEFIRQTAQVVYQRVTQNLQAGVREVDVFASTDESHYSALKKQNVLAQYTPLGVDVLAQQYRSIDPDGTYHVGALGFVLINYNPSAVPSPPQSWADFKSAPWKEKQTIGHPGFSGYVGNWVVAMWDKFGWDYFTELAKLDPKIGRSINDTVNDIVGGERQVGAGPDNFSLERKAQGNPINIQYPTDDSILIVSPVGIMKEAPHPNAGRLFESFMYTKEYSDALVKSFNYPVRADVAPAAGARPISEVKWYRNTAARLEEGIPAAVEKWRETFGI